MVIYRFYICLGVKKREKIDCKPICYHIILTINMLEENDFLIKEVIIKLEVKTTLNLEKKTLSSVDIIR